MLDIVVLPTSLVFPSNNGSSTFSVEVKFLASGGDVDMRTYTVILLHELIPGGYIAVG